LSGRIRVRRADGCAHIELVRLDQIAARLAGTEVGRAFQRALRPTNPRMKQQLLAEAEVERVVRTLAAALPAK